MTADPLLRAAFGAAAAAPAAWQAWSQRRDLSALPPGELRLLPPIYHNLRAAGVVDADIAAVVKQAARATWVRTRLTLREAAETVSLFAAHGVESVLLKGAALVAGGYLDAGSRPMADFDILIEQNDAARAAQLLQDAGWTGERPLDRRTLDFQHAMLFRKPERGCDLHWWTLWESIDPEGDRRFRTAAEKTVFDGVTLRIPRPEHQLMHTIVHGTRAFDSSTVRWIGDALALLRQRATTFDWALFEDEVVRRGVSYPVGDALEYLSQEFDALVSHDVVTRLRARRVARWQRRFYAPQAVAMREQTPIAFLQALGDAWFGMRRDAPLQERLLWLPRHLQHAFGAARLRDLPLTLLRLAMRKLASRVRRR